MSTLRSDNIVGRDQQSSPNFPKGAVVSGVTTSNTFVGELTGNVTGNVTGAVTGNADTATKLETARNIGGVSFDGTAAINLPGVNITGNQNTTGTAAGLSDTPDITVGQLTSGNINSTGIVTAATGSFSGNVSIGGTLTYEDVKNVDSVGIVTAGKGLKVTTGGIVVTAGVSTVQSIESTSYEGYFILDSYLFT